jgi:ribonuclease E
VAPHTNGVQLVVVAAGQLPAPSQLAAAVATPDAQLAARHEVVAGALAQAPPAAQAPVLPHGGAAVQRASVAPVVTLAQVPLAPPVLAAEQAVQAPVQAVLQQNPSTQAPVAHWLAAVQVPPVAFFGVQVVPEQKSPAMQSVSAPQVVLQAVAPQTSGVQLVVVAAGQLPAPSQLAAATATPLAQLAARHDVVAGALAQAPPAAQAPVLPHGGAATQRASAVPAVAAAQVPLAPPVLAAEQAVQAPVQAVLQQNPSTQLPEAHWLAAVQAAPLARHVPPAQATHTPFTH